MLTIGLGLGICQVHGCFAENLCKENMTLKLSKSSNVVYIKFFCWGGRGVENRNGIKHRAVR